MQNEYESIGNDDRVYEEQRMRLIIIGASGHGRVVADIAALNGFSDIVFLDDDEHVKENGRYPVMGKSGDAPDGAIFVAVGNAAYRKWILECPLPDTPPLQR